MSGPSPPGLKIEIDSIEKQKLFEKIMNSPNKLVKAYYTDMLKSNPKLVLDFDEYKQIKNKHDSENYPRFLTNIHVRYRHAAEQAVVESNCPIKIESIAKDPTGNVLVDCFSIWGIEPGDYSSFWRLYDTYKSDYIH